MAAFETYGRDVSGKWVILASQGSHGSPAGADFPVLVVQSDDLMGFVLGATEEEPFCPSQHLFAEEFLPPGALLFASAQEAARFLGSQEISTSADCFLFIQVV